MTKDEFIILAGTAVISLLLGMLFGIYIAQAIVA
jgi:uncharacterized protein YneF (UPF0154 family)